MAANEKLGWFAQLSWTGDARLAFKLITKVAGGTQNVNLDQIAASRANSEKVLNGIGSLGSGLDVDYVNYETNKDGSISRNVTGFAVPSSGNFTWTALGIGGQEITESTRTLVHESGHAVLGLVDKFEGYSGPKMQGVDYQEELGYWSGYRWNGIAIASALGLHAASIHNGTRVLGRLQVGRGVEHDV